MVREAIRDLIWEHDVPDDPDHGHHQDWQGYNEEDRAAYIEWAKRVEAGEEGPGKFGPCRPLPGEGLAANMEMIRTGRASYEMLYPPAEGFCRRPRRTRFPDQPGRWGEGDGVYPLMYCPPGKKRKMFKEFLTEAIKISIHNVAHEAANELARPFPTASECWEKQRRLEKKDPTNPDIHVICPQKELEEWNSFIDILFVGTYGFALPAKAAQEITTPIASKAMRNIYRSTLELLGKPPVPPGAGTKLNLIPGKKGVYDKTIRTWLKSNKTWSRRFVARALRTPLRFTWWVGLAAYVGTKVGYAFSDVSRNVWDQGKALLWQRKFEKVVQDSQTVRSMINQMTNMAFQKGEMFSRGESGDLMIKPGTVGSWGVSLSEEIESSFSEHEMPFIRRVIWTLMGLVQVDYSSAFFGETDSEGYPVERCGFDPHKSRKKRKSHEPGLLPSEMGDPIKVWCAENPDECEEVFIHGSVT